MNANGVLVHTRQQINNGISGKVLKDGTSVLVRVTENNGNGNYKGYVAGVKVNIHSQKNFMPGATFPALITVKEGIITLNPKLSDVQITESFNVSFLQNNQILKLLESLGLGDDEISVRLLLQMKQMEMKIDSSLINKIKNLSVKYKEKSKYASELLLILEEKGLKASAEELELLLELIEKNDTDSELQKNDYCLINRINKSYGAWFIVPFNLVKYESEDIIGNGLIYLLKIHDNLKKLNLDFTYKSGDFLFNLNFDNKKCTEVMCGFNKITTEKKDNIIKQLHEYFAKRNIMFQEVDFQLLKGTGCETEPVYAAGGLV